MKKTLAIILALAMVFSTLTVAFAEETIGVDAQACATLGMLKGNTSAGVTADYVATNPTRIQAALLFLRLKGLEQTALEYTGTDNFVDADQVSWDGYKAVMAYLKANSQLGFSGIGGDKFDPNALMGANAYYKVVLTALGYRQDVDFAWADVVTFAASKNLVKVANDESFTVGDLAIATIEGLKATVKDSEKTLVASLVEAGAVTETAAVAAGVYAAPAAVVMTAAKAITNNKFEITLENAVTTAPAVSAIAVKDSTGKAMTVNSAVLSANGKVVTVTTEALTPFTPYTVTVGAVSKNIVALAIDTTKPAAPSVAVTANTSVTVTFAEEMDRATAENIANYAIDNSLTVLKAELDSTKKVITLTTSAQTVGTIYTLTVQNLTDVAGNVMDKATGYFGGMAKDTTKPAAPSVAVTANTTVTVTFAENLDKATAENIANYAIDNNLTVLKAELDADDTSATYLQKVTLTTSAQTVGTIYTMTIQNVADVALNVMDKATGYFGGMAKDTTAPAAPAVTVSDNNKVTVTFAEDMDKTTAENIANYAIDNSLVVLKAELDSTSRVITLTTSAQTVGTIYTVTVQNLADIAGNVMDKATGYFGGMAKDTAAPTASVTVAANTVTVTYSEKVDKTTATELTNYVFDGGLGYATKATLDTATNQIVTLTVASMTPGKIYNVTINNVADANGNVIAKDTKKTFVGVGAAAVASYKINAIVIVDYNTIDLVFDRELTSAEVTATTVIINEDNDVAYAAPAGLVYAKNQQADKKIVRVQFKTAAALSPDLFLQGHIYDTTITGTGDLVTASSANLKSFAGTSVANAAPKALVAVALNKTAVKVTFSEKVTNISAGSFAINNGMVVSTVSVLPTDKVTEAVLYLAAPMADTTIYDITFIAGVTDAAGYDTLKILNADTTAYVVKFAGTNIANAAPKMLAVIPVDKYTFDIVFTEEVDNAAAAVYSTTIVSGVAANLTFTGAQYELQADGKTVRVYLDSANDALVTGVAYELTYTAGTIADLQALVYDTTAGANKVKFGGTSATNAKATVVAVQGISTTSVKVFLSEAIDEATSAETVVGTYAIYTLGTTTPVALVTGAVYSSDDNSVTLTFDTALNPALIYDLRVVGSMKDFNQQAMDTTVSYNFTVAP